MGIIKDFKLLYRKKTLKFKSMNNIKYIITKTRACVLIADVWEEMNRLSTNRIIKSFTKCSFISTPL